MDFLTFLQNNIVILDGSMGTLLQEKGYFCPPEKLNIEAPCVIKEIHKSYFEAGSNVITTNTFGANILKYGEEDLEEIIKSAVKIAKEAKSESSSQKEKFIALDLDLMSSLHQEQKHPFPQALHTWLRVLHRS